MVQILKEPNDLLHQKCEQVTNFEEAKKIAEELLIVVKSKAKWWNRFLGFAANQIGYPKRIIVLRKGRDEYEIFVNPEFIEKRFPFPYIENCFSLDLGEKYLVKRYLWTKIRYQDLGGNFYERVFKGLSGVYQEMDHIDGIMVSEIGLRIL